MLLEAAASGLATVAARAGGAPELVVNGESGTLVAPDDPAAFARALAALLADPRQRRRYGACGRTLAEARGWSRAHGELQQGYRSVLMRSSRPAEHTGPALLAR